MKPLGLVPVQETVDGRVRIIQQQALEPPPQAGTGHWPGPGAPSLMVCVSNFVEIVLLPW